MVLAERTAEAVYLDFGIAGSNPRRFTISPKNGGDYVRGLGGWAST